MFHFTAVIKTGLLGAVTTVIGAAWTLLADAGTSDVGPFITGGGALTSATVLGLVAVKFTRGELVARDPAKVEAALLRLVEERKTDHDDVVAMKARSDDQLERVLTALSKIPGGLE